MSEIKKILSDALVWEQTPRRWWVQSRAGAIFAEIFSQFFLQKYFPGVFKWFCLHKKVSLTTLGPSGRLSGVRHGLSQAPGDPQHCLFGQFRPI